MAEKLTLAVSTEAELAPRTPADTASLCWIHALPIAAALIRPMARGNFRLHASNAAFDRLQLAPTSPDLPHELLRAVDQSQQMVGEYAGQASFSCNLLQGGQSVSMQGHVQSLGPDIGIAGLSLLTLIDRTEELRTEKSQHRELISDPLTGLPNRTGFAEMLEVHRHSADPHEHAILLLDLSRFSRINEHIGPLAGDELVIAVARRLQNNMRAEDVIARTGGDEFGISSRLTATRADVHELARRIQACFEHPFRIGDLTVNIGCAIGGAVCTSSDERLDSADLIRHAQIALKRAKRSGSIEIYEPGTAAISSNRFSIETQLREAIDADELTLVFQPLISLSTGAVAGFEALARWDDKYGVAISPSEFIPVAEDSGLIVPLGQWAINKAVAVMAEWDAIHGAQVDCYFSVNVSPIQLLRDDIVQVVKDALERHDISGERLMIELTESAVVGDPSHALKVLNRLKALKARIAMDDFGTGYSNLAYLQRLPIDVLKIDRSFVDRMEDNREHVAIVRTIQSLAEALNLQTTAEGVETLDQARLLSALGCDFAQGYHFAHPMEGSAALDYWRRSLSNPVL